MEDIMKEIMFLCVRYHEMYTMERAIRNQCEGREGYTYNYYWDGEDMNNYETLVKAYESDKKNFYEQYLKVENLINSKQK